MDEAIKRWTVWHESALVLEIIQGKAAVAKAGRWFNLTHSEIDSWVDDSKQGMAHVPRAKPEDIRRQYERQT